MKRNLFAGLVGAMILLGMPLQQAVSAGSIKVDASGAPTQWTFSWNGKPVMVYASDPQRYKPYVKELRTLRGDDVLRDAPFDHLHHHALMYGIRVNGVNFWEETAGSGVQKAIETSTPPAAGNAAILKQTLLWLSPEHAFLPNSNAPVLLKEVRTLTLTVDEKNEEVGLAWRSEFEPGNRTNVVTLAGANYHGLGLRFRQELDPVARHFTSAGDPDLSNNRQDVSPHPWEAVYFDAPGRPATIAVFGSGGNVRGQPRFFSMRTPFAYLAATQGLDQEPLVYRQGDRFALNYLVVLYPGEKSASDLDARGRNWEQERGARQD